jgi:hypothetical protein
MAGTRIERVGAEMSELQFYSLVIRDINYITAAALKISINFFFHCFTVHFNSLYIMVQLMHLFVIKH